MGKQYCSTKSIGSTTSMSSTSVSGSSTDVKLICNTCQNKDNCCSKPDNPLDKQVDGDHYKKMKIQPVEFVLANDIPFCEGNIIKYVCRHKTKNGKGDLLKAMHFLEILIKENYGE